MENIYRLTHFDADKKPKSLQIAINPPALSDKRYPKAGDVVISLLTKEKSLGFSMSTGDVSDLVSVLTNLRTELLDALVSLRRENAGELSSK